MVPFNGHTCGCGGGGGHGPGHDPNSGGRCRASGYRSGYIVVVISPDGEVS